MDVSRLLDSMGEDSRRSSILFGIHSESKALQELERVQRQNRRLGLIAALSIFLLVAALICLIVYDLYRSRPEVILPQSWQASENVEIQGEEDTRRWGKEEEEGDRHEEAIVKEKHANHRYGEPLEERAGSKPQPFHLPKEQNSSANHVFSSPPGFTPPVRFRGIYIHPTQDPDDKNQEYYQKINDLFTSTQKRRPDNDPANSDLYTKAVYPPRQAMWNRKNTNPTRKPFTVMLDIYPMDNKDENRHLVDGHKPQDTIFVPLRQYVQQRPTVQYVPQIMIPPRQQRKRMFMKLNLFPNQRAAQKRTWNMRQDDGEDYDEDYEEDEEEEEDEDEEEEEEEEHHCNGVVGHNPYGKPITAKWKTKNGEWVHAKHVMLNQWDNRKEPR